jgi:hypothetical protein
MDPVQKVGGIQNFALPNQMKFLSDFSLKIPTVLLAVA